MPGAREGPAPKVRQYPSARPGKTPDYRSGRERPAAQAARAARAAARPVAARAGARPPGPPTLRRCHRRCRRNREERQRFRVCPRDARSSSPLGVCADSLTLAVPVRTYVSQRSEAEQLHANEEQLRDGDRRARGTEGQAADPVWVGAQARERLRFVMPGDIPYMVQLPGEGRRRPNTTGTESPRPTRQPGTAACGSRWPKRRRRPETDPLPPVPWHRPEPGDIPVPRVTGRISTPSRGSSGANPAACWRSPTVARTASPEWSRPRRNCPTAHRSRRCTTSPTRGSPRRRAAGVRGCHAGDDRTAAARPGTGGRVPARPRVVSRRA